jgi:predicted tellurium resistance membrane protein TerC
MLEWIVDLQAWIALATLIALEVVLGIDNIMFISILVGRLPAEGRDRARRIGLALAMFSGLALLFSLTWVMRLTEPLFTVLNQAISGRVIGQILGMSSRTVNKHLEHVFEKLGVETRSAAAALASRELN